MIVYRNFEGDIRRPPGAAQSDVTFKEATTVFAAEDLALSNDPVTGDLRAIGTSARGRKLLVRHQRGQRIRILGVALCDEDGREIAVPTSAGEGTRTASSTPNAEVVDPTTMSSTRGATKSASDARGSRGDEPAAERTTAVETPAPRRRGRPRPEPSAAQLSIFDVLSKAAAREPEHVAPAAIEDHVAPPIAADPRRAGRAPEAAAPAKNGEQTNGWTAETYDLYWSAYASARDEARREGKSTREAQRLGRVAGERAAAKTVEPPPKRTGRSGSWRAAARAAKIEG